MLVVSDAGPMHQVHADALLCDDGLARRLAARRHLNVIGTLGILRDAAKQRLLNIRAALDQLRTQTNFRASRDLYAAVLVEVLQELGE